MAIGSSASRGRPSTDPFRPFSVFEVPVLVREHQVPTEMSKMPPSLEDHPVIKRLSFRGDHHTIVLAPRAGVRFSPMKFERLEFQRIQRNEQVFRPLITVAAFPETVIHKKIVKDRRGKHVVLLPELTHSRVGALCEEPRFLLIHAG